MGRKLKQYGLLTKKNLLLLVQRKISVLFELLFPFVLLFAFSFMRSLLGKESICIGSFRPINPLSSIWDRTEERKIIGFSPDSDFVQRLTDQMLNVNVYPLYNSSYGGVVTKINLTTDNYASQLAQIKNGSSHHLVVFPSTELFDEVLESNSESFKAGVVFTEIGENINYTVRYHQSETYDDWQTELLYAIYTTIAWTGKQFSTAYEWSGFVFLQQLIDSSILLLEDATYLPSFVLRATPTPAYTSDLFVTYLQPFIVAMAMLIGSIMMANSVASDIIEEKCSKMREIMRMMGLSDKVMWAGWFTQRAFVIIVLSVLNTIALAALGYYPESDGTLVFVYLLLYYTAHTMFLFFLSSLQHNPKSASFVMGVLTYLSYLPYDINSEKIDGLPSSSLTAMSILPLSGVQIGLNTISNWESLGIGAKWSNLGEGISSIAPYSLGTTMIMLLIDIILYTLLTWYIENVFPGEFGVPNKWYFMFTRNYWNCGSTDTVVGGGAGNKEKEPYEDPTCHEKVPTNSKAGIVIRNLNKTFSTLEGPKTAVEDLTMEMFEGQITALLGHNGAGKTTTINMLTGMYPPTSGDAVIDGHSIITNITGVRRSMGVCPQHNILFKSMTVQQHLDFFIRLKGIEDAGEINKEIEYMLEALGLDDKRDTVSHKLSGGQKRKLSVGIALSGGSKIVMLDEPTTGMDVSGRREMWDILLKMKHSRTIIFTTHSMDEADLLGDRIAIMAAGDLVCSGSSMFLKRKYGVGYHLTLVKATADMTPGQIENITTFIQSYVPSAICNSNVGSELSYLLNAAEVPLFVKLFRQLEDSSADYGISSFGVSLTTMEEVFMKAGEGKDSNIKAIKEEASTKLIRKFDHSEMNKGSTLLWQQFKSQVKKRFILSKRNKLISLAQLIAPIFFMIIGLSTYASLEAAEAGVPRNLTLKDYPSDDIRSKIYFADMRENGTGGYTADISSYMSDNLDVDFMDVSSGASALIGSYGSSTDDCCNNPYLQLNTYCIQDLLPSNFSVCYNEARYPAQEFTYAGCRAECFKYECTGEEDEPENCGNTCTVKETPLYPIVEDVEEELNYYQNYFMALAANYTGNFYVDVQGGLTLSDRSSLYKVYDKEGDLTYESGVSVDTIIALGNTTDILTGWISFEGLHLVPAFQSALSNIVFKLNGLSQRVHVTNDPLPETLDQSFAAEADESSITLISLYIFGTAFLLAAFSQVPIDERISKSKHLQQISGVNSVVYWVAMFFWDYILYMCILTIIFIMTLCFSIEGLSGDRAGPFFLLLVMSGFACIPMVYILSHLFAKPTSAFGVITTILFLLTLVGYVTYSVVFGLYEVEETTEAVMNGEESNKYYWVIILDLAFLVHAPYAVAAGFNNLISGKQKEKVYDTCIEGATDQVGALFAPSICQDYKPVDIYSLYETGIGRHLVALAVGAVVWFGSLLLCEIYWFRLRAILQNVANNYFQTKKSWGKNVVSDAEDDNVTAERERLEEEKEQLIKSEGVVMYNLHKQFGSTTAVQNISMTIATGECFGLLGVNGAGKTTTFNMITGDTVPTAGEGYLYGFDITTHLRDAQRYIGYCPQFDALIGHLTGRELLTMFANLRGVPYDAIPASVQEVIVMFNLEDHADKECRSYSGGNKRKLSTGIAIIGSPPLIFLDEPTAGMDPTARRFLWDVLCYLRNAGCSIVLTSHSMEECEALCTKIVIMVNGANRCLGSIQELKSKYSQGYTVCLLMEPEVQTNAMNFIDENFEGAILKENYPGYLMYSLGTAYRWSSIFETMENNKTQLGLLDYSVSQTSLEQVFLNFAKEQRPEKKKKKFTDKISSCFKKKKKEEHELDQKVHLKASFVSANAAATDV